MSKKEPKIEMDIDPSLISEAVESVERAESASDTESPAIEEKSEADKTEELRDRLLRMAAEYDNFRKRVQKEKSELILQANEGLIREVLPVLDNFERALDHAKKSPDSETLRTGVELIFSQLKGVLDRFGVRSETALGQTFDPLVHEAVSHVPTPDHPPHQVIDEHQKAYFLHQRLLRPALVTVSKEVGEPDPETGEKNE